MKKVLWTLSLLPVLLIAAAFALKALPDSSALAEDKDPKAVSAPCQGKDIKAWYEKKHAEIAARDERLGDLIAEMDAAEGDEKIAAIAAVLGEMYAQRVEMHKRGHHGGHPAWHKGCDKGAKCEGKACGCSKCPASAACGAKRGGDGAAAQSAE